MWFQRSHQVKEWIIGFSLKIKRPGHTRFEFPHKSKLQLGRGCPLLAWCSLPRWPQSLPSLNYFCLTPHTPHSFTKPTSPFFWPFAHLDSMKPRSSSTLGCHSQLAYGSGFPSSSFCHSHGSLPCLFQRVKEVGEGCFVWSLEKQLKERSVFFWHIRCWLGGEAGYEPGWANKAAGNGSSYNSASKSLFKAYFA